MNRRILIVDDNRDIHDDFAKLLAVGEDRSELDDATAALLGEAQSTQTAVTYELDHAYQGQEALDKVRASVTSGDRYALAFVDMRMPPGWDGLETIVRLWQVDPEIQIVICTAYSDHTWEDIQRELGTTDRLLLLKKPFDRAEVCQLALALTEKYELRQLALLRVRDLEQMVEERTQALRLKDAELRQRHRLEAIGSLAGGVAHQFNNALQVILSYTRFVMDDLPPNDSKREDLEAVLEASEHVARIARQLIDFSRSEALDCTKHEPLDLNDAVFDADKMLRPLLGDDIELDIQPSDMAATVIAGRPAIDQILISLCVNARDAMPDGGRISICTAVHREHDTADDVVRDVPGGISRPFVILSVTDTGDGIPEDELPRIFDPFFTTKDVGKGEGLGLSVVHGLVQDCQGQVVAASVLGESTTVSIYLPWTPLSGERESHKTLATTEDVVKETQGATTAILKSLELTSTPSRAAALWDT